MEKFNVIIVGAGPGGSLAAKTAAEKGLKTVFLERSNYPGEKNSSGCGLGSKWWRDFPEILEGVFKLPSCRTCHGVDIYVLDENDELVTKISTPRTKKDREVFTYKGEEVGQTCPTIYRSDLDPYLAKLAVDAGAELRTRAYAEDVIMKNGRVCGVKLDNGDRLEADIVIAADGAYSTMAIKSGMRGRWNKEDITLVPQLDFSCDETKMDDLLPDSNILWFGQFGGFYHTNFRNGFHLGVGQWLHVWNLNPADFFRRALACPEFKRVCKMLDAKPREWQTHLLPWMKHPPKTYTAGMMLVGDAAGFPCPLEAEGIWHACYSGRIAAEVAAEAIFKGDPSEAFLSEYERRWEASYLGREYDFGKEWVTLWCGSVFSAENMVLFSQLIGELQWFNFFPLCMDWSDDHMTCINRHLGHVLDILEEIGKAGNANALAPVFSRLGEGITAENKFRLGKIMAPLAK